VSDTLTIVGGAGVVAGSVVNGISATGVKDHTRKSLLTAGIITTGVGAVAFGTGAALGLNKQSTALAAAAQDQEYAAAVLGNDKAGDAAWSRAWANCISAEGAEKSVIPDNPAGAFNDAGAESDAGQAAGDGADGGAADGGVGDAGSPSDAGGH
jgi:hypothetical protein